MSLLELLIPARKAVHSRLQRWPGNLVILAFGNIIASLLTPVLPYTVSVAVSSSGWGLSAAPLPQAVQIAITVLVLDAGIYLQHMLFHRLPLLKNLHRMHHTDTHLDVTSALRFHPLEIIISILFKSVIVLLFGLNPAGILVFEILLNGSAMFNHSNIRIGEKAEKILRLFIITPAFHRIHHSRVKAERNSNYGFFLSIWDRIFSTWTENAEGGEKALKIGITGYDDPSIHRIDKLILDPFRFKKPAEAADA